MELQEPTILNEAPVCRPLCRAMCSILVGLVGRSRFVLNLEGLGEGAILAQEVRVRHSRQKLVVDTCRRRRLQVPPGKGSNPPQDPKVRQNDVRWLW